MLQCDNLFYTINNCFSATKTKFSCLSLIRKWAGAATFSWFNCMKQGKPMLLYLWSWVCDWHLCALRFCKTMHLCGMANAVTVIRMKKKSEILRGLVKSFGMMPRMSDRISYELNGPSMIDQDSECDSGRCMNECPWWMLIELMKTLSVTP